MFLTTLAIVICECWKKYFGTIGCSNIINIIIIEGHTDNGNFWKHLLEFNEARVFYLYVYTSFRFSNSA